MQAINQPTGTRSRKAKKKPLENSLNLIYTRLANWIKSPNPLLYLDSDFSLDVFEFMIKHPLGKSITYGTKIEIDRETLTVRKAIPQYARTVYDLPDGMIKQCMFDSKTLYRAKTGEINTRDGRIIPDNAEKETPFMDLARNPTPEYKQALDAIPNREYLKVFNYIRIAPNLNRSKLRDQEKIACVKFWIFLMHRFTHAVYSDAVKRAESSSADIQTQLRSVMISAGFPRNIIIKGAPVVHSKDKTPLMNHYTEVFLNNLHLVIRPVIFDHIIPTENAAFIYYEDKVNTKFARWLVRETEVLGQKVLMRQFLSHIAKFDEAKQDYVLPKESIDKLKITVSSKTGTLIKADRVRLITDYGNQKEITDFVEAHPDLKTLIKNANFIGQHIETFQHQFLITMYKANFFGLRTICLNIYKKTYDVKASEARSLETISIIGSLKEHIREYLKSLTVLPNSYVHRISQMGFKLRDMNKVMHNLHDLTEFCIKNGVLKQACPTNLYELLNQIEREYPFYQSANGFALKSLDDSESFIKAVQHLVDRNALIPMQKVCYSDTILKSLVYAFFGISK